MKDNARMDKALAELRKLTGLRFAVDSEEAAREDAVERIEMLAAAYREKYDKNNFIRNLLYGNIADADIYAAASRFHIASEGRRLVLTVECRESRADETESVMKNLFLTKSGDLCTRLDDRRVVLIRTLSDSDTEEDCESLAHMVVDMINSEVMVRARVGYGEVIRSIRSIPAAFRESLLALEIGHLFYSHETVLRYERLGIGKLIYDLPEETCRMFLKQVFGEEEMPEFDDEVLGIINAFFENNLNISETARQLYLHRNTLVYRIEKIRQATGHDLRLFDDAVELKIAMMIGGSMKARASMGREDSRS